ncbi:MAG: rhamnulokinase family protein [Sphaerochaetaceae bacterium]
MEHCTVDIGASSGKMLCADVVDGKIQATVVHRFPNALIGRDGHLVWDIDRLYEEILSGLSKAHEGGHDIKTVAIDTWGVDFVLLDATGKRIGDAVGYRDKRTDHVVCPVDRHELYRRTGIQHLPFNTIYQLLALKAEHPEQLEAASALLMIPDYLSFLLTGRMHQEYTNATTSGLVDALSRQWDRNLISLLGLPSKLFGSLSRPMDVYGEFSEETARRLGFQATVLAAPSHDTASAVFGTPLDAETAFISSGTWSLLGCVMDHPVLTREAEKANFTNEGGVGGTIRFLRNLMGLWMIQSVRKEWGGTLSFNEIATEAESASDFPSRVDVQDIRFLAPHSMTEEVRAACKESGQPVPERIGEVAGCIYQSLAEGYAKELSRLETITGRKFRKIAIVGGGSKDGFLCQLTADATGRTVYAGPDEGTAFGNLLSQMMASGKIKDGKEVQAVLSRSIHIHEYRSRK